MNSNDISPTKTQRGNARCPYALRCTRQNAANRYARARRRPKSAEREIFKVRGESRIWRPNHFDTMSNFWRCERSEASDVGHKYPHRPLARKGCRLVGVAALERCCRLPAETKKLPTKKAQCNSQVACRATRPPFGSPSNSKRTPLVTTAPGTATGSLSGRSKLLDMYSMCRD